MGSVDGTDKSEHGRDLLERAVEADERGEYDVAFTLFRRAIDAGLVEAYSALGFSFYEQGEPDKAAHWWSQGADAGDTESMTCLASLHFERDELAEALHWWTRAAKAGDPEAMVQVARFHIRMKQVPQAMTWFRRAAGLGSTEAMDELAGIHHDRGEIEVAEPLYRQAANLGNTESMIALGAIYSKERKDDRQARAWFQKAIDAGDAQGFAYLGAHCNLNGRTAESVQAFQKAADAGVAWAMVALGNYYRSQRDFGEAREWYTKAEAAGDPEAEDLLREVAQSRETSSGCFIATAVYGSYDAPEVLALRRFRDRKMARSSGGRAFIRIYYRLSPHLATRFEPGGGLSRIGRRLLDRLVAWVTAHESP